MAGQLETPSYTKTLPVRRYQPFSLTKAISTRQGTSALMIKEEKEDMNCIFESYA